MRSCAHWLNWKCGIDLGAVRENVRVANCLESLPQIDAAFAAGESCCESRYVDAHHIQHWAESGETSLDNLVALCRYHHRQLHRGTFSVSAESSGSDRHLVFKTPGGHTLETSLVPQFPEVSFPEVVGQAF